VAIALTAEALRTGPADLAVGAAFFRGKRWGMAAHLLARWVATPSRNRDDLPGKGGFVAVETEAAKHRPLPLCQWRDFSQSERFAERSGLGSARKLAHLEHALGVTVLHHRCEAEIPLGDFPATFRFQQQIDVEVARTVSADVAAAADDVLVTARIAAQVAFRDMKRVDNLEQQLAVGLAIAACGHCPTHRDR